LRVLQVAGGCDGIGRRPPVNPSQIIPPAGEAAAALAQFGLAWLILAGAIALHVADEALTGFLGVYNPAVRAIRARLPWLPLPTFTFPVWIAGLAAGVALLLALGPAAYRGTGWVVVAALPLSVAMMGNGLGHIVASLYKRRLMPGVVSSPVLIAASAFALRCALRLL
jgi:hypothetical protein